MEFIEDGGELSLRRHVGESPSAPCPGHLSHLRRESPDAIIEELRSHP